MSSVLQLSTSRHRFVHENSIKKKIFLLTLFGICVVAILTFIVFIITTPPNPPLSAVQIDEHVCKTQGCQEAAEYFKSSMNLSAEPCEDFFNYACGKWVENNKMRLPEQRWWTAEDLENEKNFRNMKRLLSSEETCSRAHIVKSAKLLFKSCTQKDFFKENDGLQKIVKNFGGFPMYNLTTYDRNITWYERSAKVIRQFGFYKSFPYERSGFEQGIILNIIIEPLIGLTLSKPNDYYKNPSHYRSSTYQNEVRTFFCETLTETCSKNEQKRISKEVEELTELQSKMAEYVMMKNQNNIQYTIKELEVSFPDLHVHGFLKELFNGYDMTIGEDTEISGPPKDYWANVTQLLISTKPATIDNLIGWSNFEILEYNTPQEIPIKAYRFLNAESDLTTKIENNCFFIIQRAFPLVISRLFVDKYFDDENIIRINEVFLLMRKALIKMIQEKKWLGSGTLKEAVKKIQLMGSYVGYPQWLKIDSKLDGYYFLKEDLTNHSLIEMYGIVFSFVTGEILATAAYPHYKDNVWLSILPHENNAQYQIEPNSIILPATQCMPPLFWPNATAALAFGSASSTIGHEITHSVDTGGSKFDAHGNFRDWWDAKSKKIFEEKANCIKKQYSSIFDPTAKMNLNGHNTIEEDISDNGGLRMAYKAYLMSGPKDERLPGLEHLNDKQLFFITAGILWCGIHTEEALKESIKGDEVHSPHTYRVYMPSSNMEEFSQAFNCRIGSKMNREKKCVVW